MIGISIRPAFTTESTPTAEEAESFLHRLRRLEGYWEEGLLSTEELQEAVAKLHGTESVPQFLPWGFPDLLVPLD